ncbi:MAG TPA: Hsp33 family molecular chaperone HslO [Geminicoccus sp.]|uniref:Hsp33 family molecular chaperone HslO n=1 Tax=Geminicoccus sp. TaxID=2024832 RepID=UPI002CF51A00|nr:Hsp33 family molecular chaperone HslO [Geminicoccus sp.]HWL72022.1 Hsp33 family molecular chaperone HslO [Geminicoccus sp.]
MSSTNSVPIDTSRPFQLDRTGLRGRSVRLGPALDEILERHDYPEPVARALGELVMLAAALAGELKFDGSFSLQVRGEGPVTMMVADCTNAGILRGYAAFGEGVPPQAATIGELCGKGVLAVTLDQSAVGGETQQGIVELEGATLTDCMLTYFQRSQQIRTGMRFAVSRESGSWTGGGIVVQALPEIGGKVALRNDDEDDWRRAMVLLGTVTPEELLGPEPDVDTVLHRLFHEEEVRVYPTLALAHGCRCSAERFAAILRGFSAEEVEEMRQPDRSISATCQFCSRTYRFQAEEVDAIETGVRH